MGTVTLRDATRIAVRPIRPEDEEELIALHTRLGRETAWQRFLTLMPRLPVDWAHKLADVDYDRRMAILAFAPGDELIAVARYAYDDAAQEPEVAIVSGPVAEPGRMLKLLTRLGEVRKRQVEDGVVSLLFTRRAGPGDPRAGGAGRRPAP